jgi:glutathione synthase/RimK-type ligase-like ATP-grasp enzyme
VTGRVAFAASPEALDLDAGWPLLRDAVAAAGLEPAVVSWEDPAVDWAEVDLVVANYTWGYVTRRERFLAWAAAVARRTRLVNPEPVLRWNSDKAYLAELAAAGVPTVPTTRVPAGAAWDPPARDYVVKPSVSSGGIEAVRYVDSAVDTARRHVERLHAAGQTVLVQPYLPAVDAGGETSLVWFGERFSHAVAKGPVLEPDAGPVFGLWERQALAVRAPREDQLALAERALAAAGATAYARVDVVDDADGRPVVMELELVEPSLFLHLVPEAAPRFAAELVSAARRAPARAARRETG